jgi:hypothetical protein
LIGGNVLSGTAVLKVGTLFRNVVSSCKRAALDSPGSIGSVEAPESPLLGVAVATGVDEAEGTAAWIDTGGAIAPAARMSGMRIALRSSPRQGA